MSSFLNSNTMSLLYSKFDNMLLIILMYACRSNKKAMFVAWVVKATEQRIYDLEPYTQQSCARNGRKIVKLQCNSNIASLTLCGFLMSCTNIVKILDTWSSKLNMVPHTILH